MLPKKLVKGAVLTASPLSYPNSQSLNHYAVQPQGHKDHVLPVLYPILTASP
jgi:hypothetical protein